MPQIWNRKDDSIDCVVKRWSSSRRADNDGQSCCGTGSSCEISMINCHVVVVQYVRLEEGPSRRFPDGLGPKGSM